jgi:hypothetical protein
MLIFYEVAIARLVLVRHVGQKLKVSSVEIVEVSRTVERMDVKFSRSFDRQCSGDTGTVKECTRYGSKLKL